MSEKPEDYEWIFVLGYPVHRTEFYKLLFFGLSALSILIGFVVYFCWGFFFPEAARDEEVIEAEQEIATEVITEVSKSKLDLFFEDQDSHTPRFPERLL